MFKYLNITYKQYNIEYKVLQKKRFIYVIYNYKNNISSVVKESKKLIWLIGKHYIQIKYN